jgi:glyoxylase-like metal-dependent hydrolase (beta-lactamase superfamily II)
MQPVTIGNIEVRRVEEMIWTISPRFLFVDVTYDDFARHRDWLVPHFCAADLKLRLSIHTFVVRTPQHTILVDTCIGNDRKRDVPLWTNMRTDYRNRLIASGVNPTEVDYVFCTHMHVDHVGWNTHLENGQWVPTFPNARYLFHHKEWEFWKDTQDENQAEVMHDSVLPIVQAGLAVMVEADHVIDDGIRLEPTPGHTPGHCSVHLSSQGAEAVITGDMMHHPAQIAEPHWTSRACWNRDMAVKTRHEFVQRYADTATLILGTHFAPPTALHIVSHGDTLRVRY